MKGFKDFLMQGNLIDLAVAVVIGAAFGDVVKAFTGIIMGIIGLLGGQPDFSQVAIGGVNVGLFINALVAFIIIAAVIYFFVIKPYTALKGMGKKEEEAAAPTSEELLTEIRDLLAKHNQQH